MSQIISCPNCQHEFPIEDILLKEEKKALEESRKKLASQEEAFIQKKAEENRLFKERLSKETEKIKQQLSEEQMSIIKTERENIRKEEQLKIAREANKEQEKLLEQLQQTIQENATIKQKYLDEKNERIVKEEQLKNQIIQQISTELNNKHQQILQEKNNQLESVQRQVQILEQKARQGSMKNQGDAQEILLEDLFNKMFPFDTIERIGTGKKGGDIIQTVYSPTGTKCGKILYESKYTKDYNKDWIPKLKEDILNEQALLGVIVTQAFPKGMTKCDRIDGVWVMSFEEAKSIPKILREIVLKEARVKAQTGMQDGQKEALYTYITSPDFYRRVEEIVKTFTLLKEQIEREKKVMQTQWAIREKQIEIVLNKTIDIYGSIKGIGGESIQNIPLLELSGLTLPDTNEDTENKY